MYDKPPTLITRLDDLPPQAAAGVSAAERRFCGELETKRILPFAVTSYYAALAGSGNDDPIRRQFIPDPREDVIRSYERSDPLGEALFRVAPRLVHQFTDRVLLLANGACPGYCRHCFRRCWTGERHGFITDDEIRPILAYLRGHAEIKEVLVSGGDPLMVDDGRLASLFTALRTARPGCMIRICSRMPIAHPARLSSETIASWRRFRPLRLAFHINHPRELAKDTKAVLSACVDAGIPIHSQTVLLRGINDSPAVLAELFRELATVGATPYYLFQGDLAPGTSHLRVSLVSGLSIYASLKQMVSGLCLPKYVVDLPGGGGKIALSEAAVGTASRGDDGMYWYSLKDAQGRSYRYPAEA